MSIKAKTVRTENKRLTDWGGDYLENESVSR